MKNQWKTMKINANLALKKQHRKQRENIGSRTLHGSILEGLGRLLSVIGALLGAMIAFLGRFLGASLVSWVLWTWFWVGLGRVLVGFGEDLGRVLRKFWRILGRFILIFYIGTPALSRSAPRSVTIFVKHFDKNVPRRHPQKMVSHYTVGGT